MDWTKALDTLKLGPRVWFAVLTVATFSLFARGWLLDTFALSAIITEYRSWLGLIWVVSAAFLTSHVFAALGISLKTDLIQPFAHRRRLRVRLSNLTPDERGFLGSYLKANTRTLEATLGNGVVAGLARERIVYRASSVASDFTACAFNIEPWVWSYLRKHPELVDLTAQDLERT